MGLYGLGEDSTCRGTKTTREYHDILQRERRLCEIGSVAVADDVDAREGIQADVWGVEIEPDDGGEGIAMGLLWLV